MKKIDKGSVVITKYTTEESIKMVNSQPYLKTPSTDDEINTLMKCHNLTYGEARKSHEENLAWAM